jgi:hypothetical protein
VSTSVYPLAWPPHFPRARHRETPRFKATLAAALENVRRSITLFAKDSGKSVNGIVISSNYALGSTNPDDPGVAVYFVWDGLNVCIPVDRYSRIEGNLQAVHHIIEARRVELRHGSLQLIRATFQGFAALPAPSSGKPWRDVLGITDTEPLLPEVERAFKQLAAKAHPDNGGSHAAMSELTVAITEARKELSV